MENNRRSNMPSDLTSYYNYLPDDQAIPAPKKEVSKPLPKKVIPKEIPVPKSPPVVEPKGVPKSPPVPPKSEAPSTPSTPPKSEAPSTPSTPPKSEESIKDMITRTGRSVGRSLVPIGASIAKTTGAISPTTYLGVAGASAAGLGAYALYKHIKRKRDEKLLNAPDDISPEDAAWKSAGDETPKKKKKTSSLDDL